MIAPRLSGKIKRQVNAESPSVVDVTQTSPAHAARSGADAALYVCRRSRFFMRLTDTYAAFNLPPGNPPRSFPRTITPSAIYLDVLSIALSCRIPCA